LAALPTRDATLPILANLFAAAEQGVSLSALWDRLPARFGRAGLIDNFPVAASQSILANLILGGVIEVELDGVF
jgi:phosphomannomutase